MDGLSRGERDKPHEQLLREAFQQYKDGMQRFLTLSNIPPQIVMDITKVEEFGDKVKMEANFKFPGMPAQTRLSEADDPGNIMEVKETPLPFVKQEEPVMGKEEADLHVGIEEMQKRQLESLSNINKSLTKLTQPQNSVPGKSFADKVGEAIQAAFVPANAKLLVLSFPSVIDGEPVEFPPVDEMKYDVKKLLEKAGMPNLEVLMVVGADKIQINP